jgi:plastocyanin domain-containing protein
MSRNPLLLLPLLAALVAPALVRADQVVQITVTEDGFVPAEVKVKKGEPVKLVVTRKTDRTCATEIVVKDYGVEKKLPLGVPVEVTFTPSRSGKVRYACGMDMISGVLVVQ